MMNDEMEQMWKAAFDHPGEAIPVGRSVVCDICDQDWTDRPESGGFLFVSKAYCPDHPSQGRAMNLPPMPDRIKLLKRDERGFPVPWFVHWQDDKPDFRVISPDKLTMAFRGGRCWICGGMMGVHRVCVIGPMCVVNRVTSEPPSHRDCAEFAAKACPFLTKPRMRRNEKDLPVERATVGIHLDRNPGCVALYETRAVSPFKAGDGYLFKLGEPTRVDWWAEGRRATRAEIEASIESGYPILLEMAQKDGPDAVDELMALADEALKLLPAA